MTARNDSLGPTRQDQAGMVPDDWNAAVQLQCAVRDHLVGEVITLGGALRLLTVLIRHHAITLDAVADVRASWPPGTFR